VGLKISWAWGWTGLDVLISRRFRLASNRQESKFAAKAGEDSMKTVPKVLGINQCSFTILSPDLYYGICQYLNLWANLQTIIAANLTLLR
jgi:hypothetical protein